MGSLQPSSIAPFSNQQGDYLQDNMQTYAPGRLEQIKTARHGPELRSGSDRPTGILEVVKSEDPISQFLGAGPKWMMGLPKAGDLTASGKADLVSGSGSTPDLSPLLFLMMAQEKPKPQSGMCIGDLRDIHSNHSACFKCQANRRPPLLS